MSSATCGAGIQAHFIVHPGALVKLQSIAADYLALAYIRARQAARRHAAEIVSGSNSAVLNSSRAAPTAAITLRPFLRKQLHQTAAPPAGRHTTRQNRNTLDRNRKGLIAITARLGRPRKF